MSDLETQLSPQPPASPAPSAQDQASPPDQSAQAQAPSEAPKPEPTEAEKQAAEIERQRREIANAAYAIRAKERELKTREAKAAELDAKEKAIAEREAALREFEAADEFAVLEKVAKRKGLQVDDLLRRAIARAANNGNADPAFEMEDLKKEVLKVAAKNEELAAELKRRDEEATKRSQEQEAQAIIDNYRDEAISHLEAGETYPILSSYDPEEVAEAVLQTADRYAAKTGEVPSVADVLEYLEKQEQQKLEKVTSKLGYQRQVKDVLQPAPQQPQRGSDGKFLPRGITNNVAGERGAAPVDYKSMTDRERIQQAAREVLEPLMRR